MGECNVTFQGTVNGLTIIMRENDCFDNIFEQIIKKVESAGKFFNGALVEVRYRGKKLSKEQEEQISDLLSKKAGAKIKRFADDESKHEKALFLKDTSTTPPHFEGLDEGFTRFYKGTVRSGQLVSSQGNLVVIGDVNPGGEIAAYGNVVVMGSLRGVVHAGADGNRSATIIALNINPTQLRIADVITRPPDEKDAKFQFFPELAYVKSNTVYIDRYIPQR